MAIAITLKQYLSNWGMDYEVVTHPRALTSQEVAAAAHVPGECMAKAVLLRDDDGYLLAVVPATHRVELGALREQLQRRLELASEEEIAELFRDCDFGAVPPVGAAYGVEVVLDDSLAEWPEVYFEAGDHTSLIHMSAAQFEKLMGRVRRGRFSHHV